MSFYKGFDEMLDDKILLGELIQEARITAGLTRNEVIQNTEFTSTTLRNWEKGISSPTLSQFKELFRALGENPNKTLNDYFHPEIRDLSADDSDQMIDAAFDQMISEITTNQKRILLFAKSCNHGGDWDALLNLIDAYLQTPMSIRYAVAQLILTHYQMTADTDMIRCPEAPQPNIDVLQVAINKGRDSAVSGKSAYSMD